MRRTSRISARPPASRRHGREVRRRCGHGGFRDPGVPRGRRSPRGACSIGDACRDRRSTAWRRGSGSTRAGSSSVAKGRRSSPVMPSTSRRASSKQPARGDADRRRDPAARSRCREGRARRAARVEREVGARRGLPPTRGCSTTRVPRPPPRDAARRERAGAPASLARLRGCRGRPHVPSVLAPRACRIGKSRLVADFLERVGDEADVLRGRCLSYGEGITYWPLVEILISVGVDPESVIGTSPAGDAARFPAAPRETGGRDAPGRCGSMISSGRSRRSSTSSSTSPTCREARRSSSSYCPNGAAGLVAGVGRRQAQRDVPLARAARSEECSALMDELVADAPLTRNLRSGSPWRRPGKPLTSRRCSRWCASTG